MAQTNNIKAYFKFKLLKKYLKLKKLLEIKLMQLLAKTYGLYHWCPVKIK